MRSFLCADLIGFQLFEYARKFFVCVKRLLNLDYHFLPNGQLVLEYGGRNVSIRVSHVCIQVAHVLRQVERLSELQKAVSEDRRALELNHRADSKSDSDDPGASKSSSAASEGGRLKSKTSALARSQSHGTPGIKLRKLAPTGHQVR